MLARYAALRVLALIPVATAISVVISVVIFMIVHLLPGDPIDNLIRLGSSPEERARLSAEYGLDRPLVVQYARWAGAMLQGDFGDAIVLRQPVADLIAQNLPYSLALGGALVGPERSTCSAASRRCARWRPGPAGSPGGSSCTSSSWRCWRRASRPSTTPRRT